MSLLLIVWGSSGIFMPMEMALNKVWGGRPHRAFWKSRLLAFVMTLIGGLLALALRGPDRRHSDLGRRAIRLLASVGQQGERVLLITPSSSS